MVNSPTLARAVKAASSVPRAPQSAAVIVGATAAGAAAAYATGRWADVCRSCDAAPLPSSPQQASRSRYLAGRLRNSATAADPTPMEGASVPSDAAPSMAASAAAMFRGGALVRPSRNLVARGSAVVVAAGERGGAVATRRTVCGLSLPLVLVVLLVAHKCASDSLSALTRTTGVPYSATTASFLAELVKVTHRYGSQPRQL